jgi:predicted DNA-binding transcriptional regulator AlpA
VDGACELSGLSRSSIYELIKRGTLESRLVNGRRLVVMASLRQLLELPAA